MQQNYTSNNEKYFAAANSYKGFKSYFDRIFAPEQFDRIYIIKGGPGTGKSSIMKNIVSHMKEKDCNIEEIYCSSDPRSLDGIICKNGEKRIALIDGTSPHETDPKIPGVIDEIINLGENWDSRWLSAKREEILALNREKSNAYKAAYSYLKIAGEAAEFIIGVIKANFDFAEAKKLINNFCLNLTCDNEKTINTRLVSAFCKYGCYKLDTIAKIAKKTIEFCGNKFSVMLALNEISKFVSTTGTSYTECPSALKFDMPDAIFIHSCSTAFVAGNNGINTDELIRKSIGYDSEITKNAQLIHDIALDEAQRWFAIASDMHFRLEKIYTQAMSFTKNESLLTKKLEEIENILEV